MSPDCPALDLRAGASYGAGWKLAYLETSARIVVNGRIGAGCRRRGCAEKPQKTTPGVERESLRRSHGRRPYRVFEVCAAAARVACWKGGLPIRAIFEFQGRVSYIERLMRCASLASMAKLGTTGNVKWVSTERVCWKSSKPWDALSPSRRRSASSAVHPQSHPDNRTAGDRNNADCPHSLCRGA